MQLCTSARIDVPSNSTWQTQSDEVRLRFMVNRQKACLKIAAAATTHIMRGPGCASAMRTVQSSSRGSVIHTTRPAFFSGHELEHGCKKTKSCVFRKTKGQANGRSSPSHTFENYHREIPFLVFDMLVEGNYRKKKGIIII